MDEKDFVVPRVLAKGELFSSLNVKKLRRKLSFHFLVTSNI